MVVWAREELEQEPVAEGEERPPREYGPEFDDTPTGFGRIAAATARQVIVQRLRDLEDEAILGDFKGREGDVVAGVIQQSPDPRHVTVDFGTVEGILPLADGLPLLENLAPAIFFLGAALAFAALYFLGRPRSSEWARFPAIGLAALGVLAAAGALAGPVLAYGFPLALIAIGVWLIAGRKSGESPVPPAP